MLLPLFQTNEYFENNTNATVVKCFEANLREVPRWVECPENRLRTGQTGKYEAAQTVHGPLMRKADAACKRLSCHSKDMKYFKVRKSKRKIQVKKKNQQLHFKYPFKWSKKKKKKQIHLLVLWTWCCYFQAAMSRHSLVTSVLLPSL